MQKISRLEKLKWSYKKFQHRISACLDSTADNAVESKYNKIMQTHHLILMCQHSTQKKKNWKSLFKNSKFNLSLQNFLTVYLQHIVKIIKFVIFPFMYWIMRLFAMLTRCQFSWRLAAKKKIPSQNHMMPSQKKKKKNPEIILHQLL